MKKMIYMIMILSFMSLTSYGADVYPELGKKYLLKSLPTDVLDDRSVFNAFNELTSRPGGIEGYKLSVELIEESKYKIYIFTYTTYDMPSREYSGSRASHFTVTYKIGTSGYHLYPVVSPVKMGNFEK